MTVKTSLSDTPGHQISKSADDVVREPVAGLVDAHDAPTDPLQFGIYALRRAGLDPLRLWSLKAPKDAGGTVSAVFLQAKAEIVFLHQLTSGRYVLFEKSTLAAVSGALVEDGE